MIMNRRSFSAILLLVLSLLVSTEVAAKGCDFDTKEIIDKLEIKFQETLKGLHDTKPYYVNKVSCEKTDNQSKYILTLFYNTLIVNNDVEHSLIVAAIDGRTKKILQNTIFKNIIQNNLKQYQVKIDTKNYKRLSKNQPIGITLFYKNRYRLKSALFIVEPTKDSFRIILDKIKTDRFTGFDDGNEQSSLFYSLRNLPENTRYPPIILNRIYTFKSKRSEDGEKQQWSIELAPAEYVYDGFKYREKNNAPIFDLSEVAQQLKEGMKFKTLVIKAILFEHSPVFASNSPHYLDITKHLNKGEKYSQSVLILEQLLPQNNDLSLAHFNLANAYWELGDKYKASLEYAIYVNQTQSKGEIAKSIALHRSKLKKKLFTKSIEGTFKEVHPDVQTVSPLLLVDKNNTIKPVAIKPWLQKKLLSTSRGRLLKVFAYEKNKKLIFLFFLKELDDEGQYHINLYRFNEEGENIEKVISIPIDNDVGNLLLYSNNNHFYQNYQVKNNELIFFIVTKFYDDDGHLQKDYFHYNFQQEKITDQYSGKSDEAHHQFSNHDNSVTVKKDFSWEDNNTLSSIDETGKTIKTLLEIKVFEGNFIIGDVNWSKDNKWLYFDNHGEILACIWRYNLETKELSKIVPEHEAEHPYSFMYKGVAHIIYIEGQSIKLARPSK